MNCQDFEARSASRVTSSGTNAFVHERARATFPKGEGLQRQKL